MSSVVYGYCRVSTTKQKIERQVDNIKKAYPEAIIVKESFSGMTLDRPEFSKILKHVKPGDTICFDEVSRMSRNANEGYELYEYLYNAGVHLVFIKEPYINTDMYRDACNRKIEMTGEEVTDVLIEAMNQVIMILAKKQIQLAFSTAQAEIDYLHQRTSEGVRKAQLNGKNVGRQAGSTVITKKSIYAKNLILKHSISFGGSLTDAEVIKLINIGRNTYYRYKKQLKNTAQLGSIIEQ